MPEVYLTAPQVAQALGLNVYTVLRYAKHTKKFPNARLLHESRRKGYRFPASDVLAYAHTENEEIVRQAEAVIASVFAEQSHTAEAGAGTK